MADNRRAYGLAKRYGIDTKGMTPAEVWEALKEKGITSNNAYDSRDDFKQTVERVNQVRGRNSAQNDMREQSRDDNSSHSSLPKVSKFNRLNTRHHIDHSREMGYKNMRGYEAAAVEFFNSNKGKLYYSEARGRYYRYEEKTGRFCVVSGGTVHTFNIYTKKKFDKIKVQDKLYEIK